MAAEKGPYRVSGPYFCAGVPYVVFGLTVLWLQQVWRDISVALEMEMEMCVCVCARGKA